MRRRDFMCKSSCSLAGLAAVPALLNAAEPGTAAGRAPSAGGVAAAGQDRRRYKIEIDIFEAREDTWCHEKGDKFSYPEDWGKLCPWLRGSLNEFVRMLEMGVTLPWKYEDTPYEKVIDTDGVTTEYVRCPDPTADLVARITRTAV